MATLIVHLECRDHEIGPRFHMEYEIQKSKMPAKILSLAAHTHKKTNWQ